MVMVYEGSALKHLARIGPEYPTDGERGRQDETGGTTARPDSARITPSPATRTPHPGERSEAVTTCGFCGREFVEDRSQATCQACPLSKACGLMRCPHCGYENAREPGWLSRIKEWIG